MQLEPDLSRSLVGIGDVHMWGNDTPSNKRDYAIPRATKLQDRVLSRGTPAGVIQIGDITEWGLPGEAVNAEAWWADWEPIPKIICPGNHDIDNEADNGIVGADTLPDWEARYGDRTQVLEADNFRVVSCLWNGTVQTPPTYGLNHQTGYDRLLAYISGGIDGLQDSSKPTAIAFHYALRDSVPGTGPPNYSGTITEAAENNLKALIANCPNLQIILTGHTHSPPWYAWPWWKDGLIGTNGREVQHHNLSATTYQGSFGNVRSPLVAYYFTFYESHLEARLLDIKHDVWIPRTNGFPRVERIEYT